LQELKNALKFVKIMQTTYMGEGLFVLRERLYKKHLCVCVCVCVCGHEGWNKQTLCDLAREQRERTRLGILHNMIHPLQNVRTQYMPLYHNIITALTLKLQKRVPARPQ